MCLNFCADFSVKHSQFTLFLYFYDCKITLFLSYTHHKITLFLVILNLLRSFFLFCTVCIAKFLFLHEATSQKKKYEKMKQARQNRRQK